MTKLLDDAFETAKRLPVDRQDDLARVILQLSGEDQPDFSMSLEDEASFEVSLAQAAHGEFATDEEVKAVWAKHGL